MNTADANAIVRMVADWAANREDIRAMALIGSWARGDPQQGSDIDLLLLSDRGVDYRLRWEWLPEIPFEGAAIAFCRVRMQTTESFGRDTSYWCPKGKWNSRLQNVRGRERIRSTLGREAS